MANTFALLLIVGSILSIGSVNSARLSKRQIGFTGGFSPASVDDATVKEMADFATKAISSNTNSGPVKLVKLTKAETQVVAGTNYKLNMELVGTGANAESRVCEAVIFDQPWTNTRKLIRSSCAPLVSKKVNKRQYGGYTEISIDDSTVKLMADFAALSLSKYTNAGPVQLVEIVHAETQVVSGQNYKLTINVSDESNNKTPFTCKLTVFDQPWTNTREMTEYFCPSREIASHSRLL